MNKINVSQLEAKLMCKGFTDHAVPAINGLIDEISKLKKELAELKAAGAKAPAAKAAPKKAVAKKPAPKKNIKSLSDTK